MNLLIANRRLISLQIISLRTISGLPLPKLLTSFSFRVLSYFSVTRHVVGEKRKLSEKTNLFTLPFRFVNLFSVNDDPNRMRN